MRRWCLTVTRRRGACMRCTCVLLVIGLVATLFSTSIFDPTTSDIHISLDTIRRAKPPHSSSELAGQTFRSTTCLLPDKQRVKCITSNSSNEIYVNFEFLRKNFNLNLDQSSNMARILFNTHRIYRPSANFGDYAHGEYLWYSNVNVETRDRVKHLDMKGVPVSSQWLKSGHLYPTQIAQHGFTISR